MITVRFPILVATISFLIVVSHATARNFRPSMMPNGSVIDGVGCINCHFNPAGGGFRNNFGNAVFNAIGGSSGGVPFWNATLAAMDSDNDGFTNGQELGDENGDGVPERTTGISNPGSASSTPALNASPSFTSTPVTIANKGVAYSYQATASDADMHTLSFFKVSGPSWLTVSTAGLVSGTPPDNANATEAVTIRVIDTGSPPANADQSYNINITASFLGWQRLNFGSGENDPNAAPGVDGEGDQVPNFIEYALRASPQSANELSFPLSFPGANATFSIDIRDDDPLLSVAAEISNQLPFSNVTTVNPVISDPTPSDGFKRLTFTDPVANGSTVNRFVRLKFTNGQ